MNSIRHNSIRHIWWSCVVAIAGGLALGACVEGAPHDKVGAAAFGQSNGPLTDDSDFAPAGAQEVTAGSGVPDEQPVQQPTAGTGTTPMMTAGTGGTRPVVNTGGSGGKAMQPTGGSGGMTGTGGSGAAGTGAGGTGETTPTTASGGQLTVTFTSVSQGGRYSPRNVGAVWIETGSGTFVKTFERWAGVRATHLSVWAGASGGWGSFFGGGNTEDKADAVSRATLSRHEAHMVTWDMHDLKGQVVPDGKYKIGVEVADDNFATAGSGYVEFEKSPSGTMVMAPDQTPFTGLVIKYQP